MITPEEALNLILGNAPVLPLENISLADAEGRVLAEELTAHADLPPFNNSAMDGFAVRIGDLQEANRGHSVKLKVRESVRAGELPQEAIGPGEAIKIMTGASLPEGSEAVVMKELTFSEENGWVGISRSPQMGENIRLKGEDVRIGQYLLRTATRIRPYEVALLAAQGIAKISVVRKPKVAVIATGNELIPATEPFAPGKIHNSNGPAVTAFLSRWKIPFHDFGIAVDDPDSLQKRLAEACVQSDVLLVTGGVSVGDFDYTKVILKNLGIKEVFWKVAIKPGKPLFFGIRAGGENERKVVFGLPGNPVAALVCLEEFVRPALEKMQGHSPKHPSYHLAGKALNDYPKPKDRQQYLFCEAIEKDQGFDLKIIRPQGSAMLGMTRQSNALAIAPIGIDRVQAGTQLAFRWLK